MDIVERIKKELKSLYELYESGAMMEGVRGARIYPILTEGEMKVIEERLGFVLSKLLRRLYLEVSNGGYGPSYGILSFGKGLKDNYGLDIIETYEHLCQTNSRDPFWKWPEKLLPICDLGCGMYICVDCSTSEGATVWFEPNPHCEGESWDNYFIPFTSSTEQWLASWLDNMEVELFNRAELVFQNRFHNSTSC